MNNASKFDIGTNEKCVNLSIGIPRYIKIPHTDQYCLILH